MTRRKVKETYQRGHVYFMAQIFTAQTAERRRGLIQSPLLALKIMTVLLRHGIMSTTIIQS